MRHLSAVDLRGQLRLQFVGEPVETGVGHLVRVRARARTRVRVRARVRVRVRARARVKGER